MQKEKKAYLLYMDLAASTDNPDIQNLFNKLAMEEAKHKLYFETQYDDLVLTEG
jgi:rubrerythrin